jgi:hypothetical protein
MYPLTKFVAISSMASRVEDLQDSVTGISQRSVAGQQNVSSALRIAVQYLSPTPRRLRRLGMARLPLRSR